MRTRAVRSTAYAGSTCSAAKSRLAECNAKPCGVSASEGAPSCEAQRSPALRGGAGRSEAAGLVSRIPSLTLFPSLVSRDSIKYTGPRRLTSTFPALGLSHCYLLSTIATSDSANSRAGSVLFLPLGLNPAKKRERTSIFSFRYHLSVSQTLPWVRAFLPLDPLRESPSEEGERE